MTTDLMWPDLWQPEAIEATLPYVGTENQLDILLDDPLLARSGTRVGGYLFRGDDGVVTIVHDRSGRADVYRWPLLRGPVLVIKLLRPGRRAIELYRHPLWTK